MFFPARNPNPFCAQKTSTTIRQKRHNSYFFFRGKKREACGFREICDTLIVDAGEREKVMILVCSFNMQEEREKETVCVCLSERERERKKSKKNTCGEKSSMFA